MCCDSNLLIIQAVFDARVYLLCASLAVDAQSHEVSTVVVQRVHHRWWMQDDGHRISIKFRQIFCARKGLENKLQGERKRGARSPSYLTQNGGNSYSIFASSTGTPLAVPRNTPIRSVRKENIAHFGQTHLATTGHLVVQESNTAFTYPTNTRNFKNRRNEYGRCIPSFVFEHNCEAAST